MPNTKRRTISAASNTKGQSGTTKQEPSRALHKTTRADKSPERTRERTSSPDDERAGFDAAAVQRPPDDS